MSSKPCDVRRLIVPASDLRHMVSRKGLLGSPLRAEIIGGCARGPEGTEAEGIVALGEADAVLVAQERAMEKGGRAPTEGTVEEELTGGGDKEIFAADDFCNLHGVIIDGAGELVTGKIVMAPDDEVAKIGGVAAGGEVLWAEAAVMEWNSLVVGNAEAPARF